MATDREQSDQEFTAAVLGPLQSARSHAQCARRDSRRDGEMVDGEVVPVTDQPGTDERARETSPAAAPGRWDRVLQRSGISRLRPGIVTGEQVRTELLSLLDRRGLSDISRSERDETAAWRRRVEGAPEHDLWFWFVMWPMQQDKNEMYAEWIRAHPADTMPMPVFKNWTDDR